METVPSLSVVGGTAAAIVIHHSDEKERGSYPNPNPNPKP